MVAVQAIVFDMDDLMIDSHPIHMSVIENVLKEHDASVSFRSGAKKITPQEESSFFGLKIPEVLARLSSKYAVAAPVEELNARYNALLLANLPQLVKPMPGLYGLIKSFQGGGYKLAVASSAPRAKIDIVLDVLGLKSVFNPDWIVSGEDEIRRGKPAPDIFLKAAEKLGVMPAKCLVLEDARNGVEAAKAAGMYCIGVHNQFTYERLGIRQDLGGLICRLMHFRRFPWIMSGSWFDFHNIYIHLSLKKECFVIIQE